MKISEIELSKIKPYPDNPRIVEDAIDEIAESIKEFGFQQPIVIDAENVIIVGHGRFAAASKLDLKKVPCIVATDLSPEKVRAYRIADNKTGEASTWDLQKLAQEFELLKADDVPATFTGFDEAEIDELLKSADTEADIEIPEEQGDSSSTFNFTVKCENLRELKVIQSKMGIEGTKAPFKDFKAKFLLSALLFVSLLFVGCKHTTLSITQADGAVITATDRRMFTTTKGNGTLKAGEASFEFGVESTQETSSELLKAIAEVLAK